MQQCHTFGKAVGPFTTRGRVTSFLAAEFLIGEENSHISVN